MKKIPVSELKPGMKLAKDVHLNDGRLLLLSGFIIKQRYLRKLEIFEIPFVYIEEGIQATLEDISEERVYSEAFNTIKSVLTAVRDGKDLDISAVKDTVNDIVHKVINNEAVFMQLTGIRDIDSYTFLHSVDVCIYSVITGKNMGFSKEELTELGISAVLHDIGKCKVPLEILMKPGRLTDEEFHIMKLQTIYGHDIINNTPGLSKRVANVACMHHEKWDGQGYPRGLKGAEIPFASRVISIAETYERIRNRESAAAPCGKEKAVQAIREGSGKRFDPELAVPFADMVESRSDL
jgi:HD-GYP domain-containing protein (c-di-GMP phosphodiesterase class II)